MLDRMRSWVEVPEHSDFTIQNLPFGIFSENGGIKRVGVAIGDYVLDMRALFDLGYINYKPFLREHFNNEFLNDLISLGKPAVSDLRLRIQELLNENNSKLKNDKRRAQFLLHKDNVTMHMPVKVGDYTDFYSSEDHARNVGIMFRDPANALLPNWKHLPVGYHGRSSSIVLSGVPIHRPKGQTKPVDTEPPVFGPSKQVDFELEMAFITYPGKPMGEHITTDEANDYIFGMVIFNDWSARDIQKWEYVPLGPFLAKNFGSSISPWIVTMEALDIFKTKGPKQDPKLLPYLEFQGKHHYDIHLQVFIKTADGYENLISESNYKYMYWNLIQQLSHHTVNGCPINAGDMIASGTISGPQEGSFGSMLEIAWKGTKPIKLHDGSERSFIQDGDTVIMRAHCLNEHFKIGFGEVACKILPAV